MTTAIQIWFATLGLITLTAFIGGLLANKETNKKEKPALWVGTPRIA